MKLLCSATRRISSRFRSTKEVRRVFEIRQQSGGNEQSIGITAMSGAFCHSHFSGTQTQKRPAIAPPDYTGLVLITVSFSYSTRLGLERTRLSLTTDRRAQCLAG